MVASQGRFGAFTSVQKPRVISWGGNAETILSWGTDPASPGYNSVEFVAQEEDGWKLGLIEFSDDGPTVTDMTMACSSCHVGPKPLWGEYAFWPGEIVSDGHGNRLVELMQPQSDPRLQLDYGSAGVPGLFTSHADEFGAQVAARHAEVLLTRLDTTKAEDLNKVYCESVFRSTGLVNVFGPDVTLLSVIRDDGIYKDLRSGRPAGRHEGGTPHLWRWPEDRGYHAGQGGFGSLEASFGFLLTAHLSPISSVVSDYLAAHTNTYRVHPNEQWELHYPPGEASMAEEVAHSHKLMFEKRGEDHIDYRKSWAADGGVVVEKSMSTIVRFRRWLGRPLVSGQPSLCDKF